MLKSNFKKLFLLLIIKTANAEYQNLPSTYKNLAIYYPKIKQLNDWSCGYNVLFNACNLDNFFELKNIYSDYNKFSGVALKYLNQIGAHQKASSTNEMIEILSKKLNLKNFYCWAIENGEPKILFLTPTQISYPSYYSQREIERLLQKEIQRRQDEAIEEVENTLYQNKLITIHFGCHITVKGTGHLILISLVQNKSGQRALFIFDNLNSNISTNSETANYLSYFSKTFNISSINQFKLREQMPNKWPSMPQVPRKVKIYKFIY